MTFPNYDAIEAISSINIASQALQQQAVPLFSNSESNAKTEEYIERVEVIRTQAEKLKQCADKILKFLN